MAGTETAHEVEIAGAGDARHLGAEMPRDLHRRRADRARGTDDQNPVASLDPAAIAQEMQRGRAAERQRRRRVPAKAGGFGDDRGTVLQRAKLGMPAHPRAGKGDDRVTGGKACHLGTDCGDDTGEFGAEDRVAGAAQTKNQAHDDADRLRHRQAADAPIGRGDGAGDDADQNVVGADLRHRHLAEADMFRPAVTFANRSFHRAPCRSDSPATPARVPGLADFLGVIASGGVAPTVAAAGLIASALVRHATGGLGAPRRLEAAGFAAAAGIAAPFLAGNRGPFGAADDRD